MSLDRTVKWIDKTCTSPSTQRAEINFAKPSNTHADFSSIALRHQATRMQPRNSNPYLVLPLRLSKYA